MMRINARIPGIASAIVLISGCSHTTPYYATPSETPRADWMERLILVGDGGAVGSSDPVLATLREWSDQAPERTTVVFLGDNVYEDGLLGEEPEGRDILVRQLAATGDATALFVPGNHDWHRGRDAVKEEAQFVLASGGKYLPLAGCPGPVVFESAREFYVLALDTEWLLQDRRDGAGCDPGDEPSVRARLAELLAESEDRPVVIAAHHPPATHGPHGGFFDWQDHLFPSTRIPGASWAWVPLPVVGSLYPFVRWALHEDQDTWSRPYEDLVETVLAGAEGHTGGSVLVFAGGHDHNLQILTGSGSLDFVIVSGSASQKKLSTVTDGDDTLFAHLATGFVVLDAFDDHSVQAHVVEPGRAEPVHTLWLMPRQ